MYIILFVVAELYSFFFLFLSVVVGVGEPTTTTAKDEKEVENVEKFLFNIFCLFVNFVF